MAKLEITKGTTSKILRLFIQDTSVTTGAGLTGLAFGSAGLTAHYSRVGAAAETAITLVTATEGTYTSSGFIEMDATDLPGFYELGIPDAALATGADDLIVMLKGATNMAPCVLEIQLKDPPINAVACDWGLIKQSTNTHRLIGPLINYNTGAPITSVTLGNITAARVIQTTSVTRTALTLAGSGDNQFTHVGDGYWEIDLTTTDTGTLGRLTVTLRDDDSFHPVQASALVVPAHVYDGLVTGTDTLNVDVTQWLGTAVTAATAGVPNVDVLRLSNSATAADALEAAMDTANGLVKSDVIRISGDAVAADNLEAYTDGTSKMPVNAQLVSGSEEAAEALSYMGLQAMEGSSSNPFAVTNASFSPTTTQFETTAGDATNDHYNGCFVVWISGALTGARYQVTDYVGATKRWTVPTMTDAPLDGDAFIIV